MKENRIWRGLLPVYICVMLWLLFHRTGYQEGIPYADQLRINLIPFHTVALYARVLTRPSLRRIALINLVGNVALFVPLGFLLPRVFPRQNQFCKVQLTAAVAIIAVELLQLFTLLGSCDIDDLILNLVGTAMGYGIHRIYHTGPDK